MNKLTFHSPEVDSPKHSINATSPRVDAFLHESDLGNLVTIWTDWNRDGSTFPEEYLSEVIQALQGIQAARAGSEAKA